MKYTVKEVLQFIEGNDVKFVKLVFFDIFGIKKVVSIMAEGLRSAFEYGVPISADSVCGFNDAGNTELLLFPDPCTLKILTWRSQQGSVVQMLCDIRMQNGDPFDGDVRSVLKKAVQKAKTSGLNFLVGTGCEFYLFRTDENGFPTRIPYDRAGHLDAAPLDKGENVRRQICLTLEEMEITPVSSYHEAGPGQNRIDLRLSGAINAVDDFYTFKSAVKACAGLNGLYASFLPGPLKDENRNSMSVYIMLREMNDNLLADRGIGINKKAECFINGIRRRLCEMTAFMKSVSNSYMSSGNNDGDEDAQISKASVPVRITRPQSEMARLEISCADPSCNLYLALALLMFAGLEGIEKNTDDLCTDESFPDSLGEALDKAAQSSFVSSNLPAVIYENYIGLKKEEMKKEQLDSEAVKLHENRYFEII